LHSCTYLLIISNSYQKTTSFLLTETEVSKKDGKFAKARSKMRKRLLK
jgi:hypothetical protein